MDRVDKVNQVDGTIEEVLSLIGIVRAFINLKGNTASSA